jgi:hypothetical protein
MEKTKTQLTEKEFYAQCNTFKTYQVKIERKYLDPLFISLRTRGIKPDCLQYDEMREDRIIFQWNNCKPETYFKIFKWEKFWGNKIIDHKIELVEPDFCYLGR